MTYLDIQSIKKKYTHEGKNVFSIESIDLSIDKGEIFAVIGQSGCGKTSLLKIIAGLMNQDSGDVIINNKVINDISPDKRDIGMIFQQPLLFPHMNVIENIAFGLKMKGYKKKKYAPMAYEILEEIGLSGYGERYPASLSGGQQQRVSLARALILEPSLLLMDEPFSALDMGIKLDMIKLVQTLNIKYKVTIIFVTHDREEASMLAKRIAVMHEGDILQVGTPQQLYEKPHHPYVASLLVGKNIIPLNPNNKHSPPKDVATSFNDHFPTIEGWALIHPENIILNNKDISNKNHYTFIGVVIDWYYSMGFYKVSIQLDDVVLEAIESSGNLSNDHKKIGNSITFSIHRDCIHFMYDKQ